MINMTRVRAVARKECREILRDRLFFALAFKILLLSDLDRSILPNGYNEESPRARPVLRRLAERPEITLIYVTGRNKVLILNAIKEFAISCRIMLLQMWVWRIFFLKQKNG